MGVEPTVRAQGLPLLGVFVSPLDCLGHRLVVPPYGLSRTAVGLIPTISLAGVASPAWVATSRAGSGGGCSRPRRR